MAEVKPPEESFTQMMNKAQVVGGDRKTPFPGMREKTKLTWEFVRPYWDKTAWWVLLAIAVMLFMWEIDDLWSGSVYTGLGWVRESILKKFPVVPFVLGVLARHYMFRDRK